MTENIQKITSPILEKFKHDLSLFPTLRLDSFWEKVERTGTPLIEQFEGEKHHSIVTFLWRAFDIHGVEIVSYLTGARNNTLENIPGTDIWYRSFLVPNVTRATYSFRVLTDTPGSTDAAYPLSALNLDPYNKEVFNFFTEIEDPTEIRFSRSILKMPDAPDHFWSKPRPGASQGKLNMTEFSSAILKNERRIWTYTPNRDDLDGGADFNCLILFDGWGYLNLMPTTTILDNLHAAGKIQPTITVYVDSLEMETRMKELLFHDPYNQFLIEELLPWLSGHYSISSDPSRVAVSGVSAGGTAAFYAAMRHPNIFGSILAQSPALAFSPHGDPEPEWLNRKFSTCEKLALKIYYDVGTLEANTLRPNGDHPGLLSCARHLNDTLQVNGYQYKYVEFPGGHDYISWEGTFPKGLMYLFSK